MNIFYEKTTKRYGIFLGLFCAALLLVAIGGGWLQGELGKKSQLLFEKRMVSSLLDSGIQEKVITAALNNEKVTLAGNDFMEKLGRLREASFWLFPLARKEM